MGFLKAKSGSTIQNVMCTLWVFRLQVRSCGASSNLRNSSQFYRQYLKCVTCAQNNVIAPLAGGLNHRVPMILLFRIIQNEFFFFQNRLIFTSRNSYLRTSDCWQRLSLGIACWYRSSGNSLQRVYEWILIKVKGIQQFVGTDLWLLLHHDTWSLILHNQWLP